MEHWIFEGAGGLGNFLCMQFVFPREDVADFFVDVVKMQDIFFLKWGMVFELCTIFFM